MDLGRRCGVDAGQTGGGSQRDKGVTGEAADTFLEKQAPSPLTFLPGISEQVSPTARAAEPDTCPPLLQKQKQKPRPREVRSAGRGAGASSESASGGPRAVREPRGRPAAGAGGGGVKHSQNSRSCRRPLGRGLRRRRPKFGATLPPRGRRRRSVAPAGGAWRCGSGPGAHLEYLGRGCSVTRRTSDGPEDGLQAPDLGVGGTCVWWGSNACSRI